MSGRPRSRMTRSGGGSGTARLASVPVSASCTAKPSSSSPARRKRRIWISSSMTRTTGAGSVIGIGLLLRRVGCDRQSDGDRASQIDAGAVGLEFSALVADEGCCNPQAEPRAGRGRGVAGAAEEPVAELRAFLVGEADAGILDGKQQAVAVALGRHRDGGARGRIFGRVVDDLREGLLDENRIHIDERQV